MLSQEALCAYLTARGLTASQCEDICGEHPVFAALFQQDADELLTAVCIALNKWGYPVGVRIAKSLDDKHEQLQFLARVCGLACEGLEPAPSTDEVRRPPASEKDSLFQRIFTEMTLSRPEKRLLTQLFA